MTDEAYKARCFFRELTTLDVKMRINRIEYEAVFNKAQGCGSIGSEVKVQTSNVSSAMELAVAEMVELNDEYNGLLVEYMERWKEARKLLDELTDERFQNVLRLRYFGGKKMAEIAEELIYDYDYVKKLHLMALEEVGKKM
jgi:DNA-directed RNA polymerase specialized sigma subunit